MIGIEDDLFSVDDALDGMVTDQRPDLPGANSPLALVAGRTIERDRGAELRASGLEPFAPCRGTPRPEKAALLPVYVLLAPWAKLA